MVAGIKVTKDTDISFENDIVKQSIKDLVYHGITKIKGDNFEGKNEITVTLNEGDIVVYDGEERGYIVPAQRFMTVDEAIDELKCVLATTSVPAKE
jgi:predicted ABC-class ATPase